jgi:hypothetical protein
MATLNATKVSSAAALASPGVGDGQSMKCVSATFVGVAALALNDVIQSPVLQKGSVVHDVMLVVNDLDSNGAPAITLDVGYGGDPDYFIAASTVGQAGGVARASALTAEPLVLADNDTIDVLVKAGPATGVATPRVTISVFFMPPNA